MKYPDKSVERSLFGYFISVNESSISVEDLMGYPFLSVRFNFYV